MRANINKSIMVLIPKKSDAKKLMRKPDSPHPKDCQPNIYNSNIIFHQKERCIKEFLTKDQLDFTKSKQTTETIFATRHIREKMLVKGKRTQLGCIDIKKCFTMLNSSSPKKNSKSTSTHFHTDCHIFTKLYKTLVC